MLNYAGKAGKVNNGYTATLWPAVMVTAVTLVEKSHCRQTARVAEGLPDRRWE